MRYTEDSLKNKSDLANVFKEFQSFTVVPLLPPHKHNSVKI